MGSDADVSFDVSEHFVMVHFVESGIHKSVSAHFLLCSQCSSKLIKASEDL